MPSVYVVCWIFLQTFQTYFCIQANSVDLDQTAPRSSLIWVHTVCRNDFQNHKQMTKQTTIVVIGSLRVKIADYVTVTAYGFQTTNKQSETKRNVL